MLITSTKVLRMRPIGSLRETTLILKGEYVRIDSVILVESKTMPSRLKVKSKPKAQGSQP